MLMLILVSIVIIGGVLYNRSRPIKKINQNIPAGFLYTSLNEKIPEENYLPGKVEFSGQVDSELILAEPTANRFDCKKTAGDDKIYPAAIVSYYEFAPGYTYGILRSSGGWSFRYAVVCENNYFIVDGADHFGIKMYGPFSAERTGR